MKKSVLFALSLLVTASSWAAPLFTVGDELDVLFNGGLIGKWDSNVFYSRTNKRDDYVGTMRLGAEANYGRTNKFTATVRYYEDLNRYLTFRNLNSNLANVFLHSTYKGDLLNGELDFSFQQLFQNTPYDIIGNFNPGDEGRLIRRDRFTAGIKGLYDLTEKIYLDLGFRWIGEYYVGHDRSIYSDSDVFSFPISALYRVTQKMSVGLSYQYRYTTFSGGDVGSAYFGASRHDHFFGATVRGEILPKLSSKIYVGGSYRELCGADSSINDRTDLTFACNHDLTYQVTEKLSSFLTFSRDFVNGSARQSSINTGGTLGVRYAFSQFLDATASIGYINTDYISTNIDRVDDTVYGRVGITYTPNNYLTFAGGYSYYNNASDNFYACYNRHLFDISFSVRY